MRTKHLFSIKLAALLLMTACVEELHNQVQTEKDDINSSPSARFRTKATGINDTDSLKVQSKIQSDVENLLMSRIVFRDSAYVLSLSQEAAAIIGIPNDIFNMYLGYVEELNMQLEH